MPYPIRNRSKEGVPRLEGPTWVGRTMDEMMSRLQYAYYRKPDGGLYDGTDGKHAPNHILSEIGKTSFLSADGEVAWHGLDVMLRFKVALRSAFVILGPDAVEVNENDSWDIVWKALVALIRNAPREPIASKELLERVNIAAAAFFREPPAQYVLVTSLSVGDFPARQIRVGACVVTPLKERGKRFPFPETLSAPSQKSAFASHIRETQYKTVRVSVLGRSIHDAADKALESVHLLRALWSLPATYGSWSLFRTEPVRKPLGVIHIGPIHTLHWPDGKPVNDGLYWYEPNYAGDQAIFPGDKRWVEIEKSRRWAMGRLRCLPYRSELKALLIRYVRALDEADMDVAFLQMWSILEKITGTIGAKYDETIKKAVWVLAKEERPLAGNILGLLRCRRNQYVHSGRVSQEEGEKTVYLIKSLVDLHLGLLLSNVVSAHNLAEYAEYLSLPAERDELLKRRRMLTKAIAYHRT
jgi:hypothetical protein